MKFSPGDHIHNGRDRDLLDSLSMSSGSSACSALSWDSSPPVLSCRTVPLKKELSEDLEEDEEHEVNFIKIIIIYIREYH